MKYILVALIALGITTAKAEGANYECAGDSNVALVRVSLNPGKGKLEYLKGGQVLLSLNLPDSAFFKGNPWDTDREYINFNPGWGESSVNIYGRISKNGSLFDIFARGMVGDVVDTLMDYHCRQL